MKTIKIFNK